MKEYIEVKYKVEKQEVIEIDGELAEYIREIRAAKEKIINGEDSKDWADLCEDGRMDKLVDYIRDGYQAFDIDHIALLKNGIGYYYIY